MHTRPVFTDGNGHNWLFSLRLDTFPMGETIRSRLGRVYGPADLERSRRSVYTF